MKDTAEGAAILAKAFFANGFTPTHYLIGQMDGEWLVVDKTHKEVVVVFTTTEDVIDGYEYDNAILKYGDLLNQY